MKIWFSLLLMLLAGISPLFAQPVASERLAVIPDVSDFSFAPARLVGDRIFFAVRRRTTAGERWEIWRNDAAAGAVRVSPEGADVEPSLHVVKGQLLYGIVSYAADGNTPIYHIQSVSPTDLKQTRVGSLTGVRRSLFSNDRLLWLDYGDGAQFYLSDGTPENTRLSAYPGVSVLRAELNDGRTLVLTENGLRAYDPSGQERFIPLPIQSPNSIYSIVSAGDYALFEADGQLWRSEGDTAKAFFTLTEARPAPFMFHTVYIWKGVAYFSFDDQQNGIELWRSDGTRAGTYMLKDLCPGKDAAGLPYSSRPQFFFEDQGALWCVASDSLGRLDLWRSDGATAERAATLGATYGLADIRGLKQLNDGGAAAEALLQGKGHEPIVIRDGEMEVFDLWPGGGDSYRGSYGRSFYEAAGQLFFTANTPGFGEELWRIGSDGRAAQVGDIAQGGRWASPGWLGATGENAYWLAQDASTLGLYRMNARAPLPILAQPPRNYDWIESIVPLVSASGSIFSAWSSDLLLNDDGSLIVSGVSQYPAFAFANSPVSRSCDFRSSGGCPYFYVARIDSTGKADWIQGIGGAYISSEIPLAKAPDGGFYATGAAQGKSFFGPHTYDFNARTMFLARYSARGDLIWLARGQIGAFGEAYDIASDAQGRIIVAGQFHGFEAQLGGITLRSESSPAYFVAAYDSDGNILWAKAIPMPGEWQYYGKALELETDAQGRIFMMTGNAWYNTFQSCAFTPRFFSIRCLESNGEPVWEQTFSATDLTFPTAMAIDARGHIYVNGFYRGEMKLGNAVLSRHCEQGSSGFFFVMNPEGKIVRTHRDDEPNQSVAYFDLKTDADGNYYQSGVAVSETQGLPYPGYNSWPYLFNRSDHRVFVRKYDPAHRLLSERVFQRRFSDLYYETRPLIALKSDRRVVLQDNYFITVDTLADCAYLDGKTGVYITQFAMPPDTSYAPNAPSDVQASDIRLSPNPVSDRLFVYADHPDFDPQKVVLSDASGRQHTLPYTTIQGKYMYIETAHLPAGMYYLRIQTGGRVAARPFVKINAP